LRKLLIAAVVAVASLASAAIALAATQHHFKQTFSSLDKKSGKLKVTKTPGAPSGTIFHSDSHDPANTSNNQQPASSKEIDVTFPAGTKINAKAIPACAASDSDFFSKGPAACPSKTQLGHFPGGCIGNNKRDKDCSGKATVRLRFPGGGDIHARVYAFNAKNGKITLYINPQGAQPIILRPKLSTGKKPVLAVKIPILCALGSPPNCGSAGEARLDSLDLTIDKLGSKSNPFIKTPPKCPASKNWVFSITYKYRPAKPSEPPHPTTQDTKTSKSPCK